MTKDDVIRLAREAGFIINDDNPMTYSLEAFAKLIAAKTRKETLEEMIYAHPTTAIKQAVEYERAVCAKLVEDSWMAFSRASNARLDITPFPELSYVAKAIRARGQA